VNDPNETVISVNGRRFRFWSSVSIRRALDTMDTINLSAPFEPGETPFQPFAFPTVGVTIGGDQLFTGTIVGVSPVVASGGRTLQVSGYSLPGVLGDCQAPVSAYPLEFSAVTLPTIAAQMCKPFGITTTFDGPAGPAFEWVECTPTTTVLSFLADLAKKRGLVISSTPAGALKFWKSAGAGSPVATLREGAAGPLLSVTPTFNPQGFYSHITGAEMSLVGVDGASYTVANPHASGTIRPHNFDVDDTQEGDLPDIVKAKAGRMFGAMVSYSVEVSTWRDEAGALWAPNTTLKLFSPGAMVNSEYSFLIRSVEFRRDSRSETATLELVLPGSFSGEIPETLPWDE
jgi:prophage tail gpP-like protein